MNAEMADATYPHPRRHCSERSRIRKDGVAAAVGDDPD